MGDLLLEQAIAAEAPSASSPDPDFEFVDLAERLAEAMIAAAETQVAVAKEALEKACVRANTIRDRATAQANELRELKARFAKYGERTLDAHEEFNGKEST